MRLGDLDALKKNMEFICMGIMAGTEPYNAPLTEIDNAETIVNEYTKGFADGERSGRHFPLTDEEKAILVRQWQPQGEFTLKELSRWLIAQGYSEGTVDDKINEFTRFVEKIRGEE